MGIPMAQIPDILLVPGQYQEIDNSLAGSVGEIKKALIVGCKTEAGTAPAGIPVRALSESGTAALCGAGSDAHLMARAFLKLNNVEECWILPLAPPDAGTKWSKTFAVSGAAVADGSVSITVCGTALEAAVFKGDSAAQAAAAITAKINSETGLPVEAAIESDTTVRLTSLVKGYLTNHITAEISGIPDGIAIEAGSVTAGSGGETALDIQAAFPQISNIRFNYIVWGLDSAAHIKNIADELESRFEAMRQIGGRAFIALSGGVEAMLAKAAQVNSPHIVLLPRGDAAQLPCVWAASFCAAVCRILADDPAANTYDTKVDGLQADAEFDTTMRQKLLEAGIATWRLDTAGSVLAERLVTSYTENTDGGRDTSYLDVQVTETVDAVRTYINAEAKKRFKTWKLAGTEENFGAGAKVMTPGVWRSFLAELYSQVFIKDKQWG
ncbi:MAG: phage tail sheath protein [Spirochaetaceae bacterium]|nr:phage tail sheath protein [Spirochaetaceae bacterium]